jgi:hypothetical protein
MFQTKVVEKTTSHILCSVTPPPKVVLFNVKKCGRAKNATFDNTAQAHCMLDT